MEEAGVALPRGAAYHNVGPSAPGHSKLRRSRRGALDEGGCLYRDELFDLYAEILGQYAPRSRGLEKGRPTPGPVVLPRPKGSSNPYHTAPPERWREVSRWRLVFAGKWAHEQHQNILECQTVVLALRRLMRSKKALGKLVIIITDSLVTLRCLAMGRSSSPRAGAVTLVFGIRPCLRWVASEHNVADGHSRGFAVGIAPVTENEAATLQRTVTKRLSQLLKAKKRRALIRHW